MSLIEEFKASFKGQVTTRGDPDYDIKRWAKFFNEARIFAVLAAKSNMQAFGSGGSAVGGAGSEQPRLLDQVRLQ